MDNPHKCSYQKPLALCSDLSRLQFFYQKLSDCINNKKTSYHWLIKLHEQIFNLLWSFATVAVTFVNNFVDLSAHYFQNIRECLAADLYPGLAVEDRLETTPTILIQSIKHKYVKVI